MAESFIMNEVINLQMKILHWPETVLGRFQTQIKVVPMLN